MKFVVFVEMFWWNDCFQESLSEAPLPCISDLNDESCLSLMFVLVNIHASAEAMMTLGSGSWSAPWRPRMEGRDLRTLKNPPWRTS
jgi:hypothetical protein